VIFVSVNLLSAAQHAFHMTRQALGTITSALAVILKGIHCAISAITTSLWSLCKNIFASIETFAKSGCTTVWRGIVSIWTNPGLSLVSSISLLGVAYLNYCGQINLKGHAAAAVHHVQIGIEALNRLIPAAQFFNAAFTTLSARASHVLEKWQIVFPDRSQLQDVFASALSAAEGYSNMWKEFIRVPSAECHFRSAWFAAAAAAVHLCVSMVVEVFFCVEAEAKSHILATVGRGAVKLALVPVVGLSFVSLSLSHVFVGFIELIAIPFAILFVLGSLLHFWIVLYDYSFLFECSYRNNNTMRRGPVQFEAPAAEQPVRNVAVPQDDTVRRLLRTMAPPTKLFRDTVCPMCLEEMHDAPAEKQISAAAANTSTAHQNSVGANCNQSGGEPKAVAQPITFLPCGHCFHEACCIDLVKSAFNSTNCPTCRAPLFPTALGRRMFL
jgi:hypothetical protein